MISKPQATCPRCCGKYTVYDATWVGPHAETVEYYAECDCGAATLSVSKGQITGIAFRDPIDIPYYEDITFRNREEPGSMAI